MHIATDFVFVPFLFLLLHLLPPLINCSPAVRVRTSRLLVQTRYPLSRSLFFSSVFSLSLPVFILRERGSSPSHRQINNRASRNNRDLRLRPRFSDEPRALEAQGTRITYESRSRRDTFVSLLYGSTRLKVNSTGRIKVVAANDSSRLVAPRLYDTPRDAIDVFDSFSRLGARVEPSVPWVTWKDSVSRRETTRLAVIYKLRFGRAGVKKRSKYCQRRPTTRVPK